MTKAQQAALRRDRIALAVFSFLNFGLTPNQIAKEFELGKQIEPVLAKLETFSGNYQNAEMVKAFLIASEYRQRFPR